MLAPQDILISWSELHSEVLQFDFQLVFSFSFSFQTVFFKQPFLLLFCTLIPVPPPPRPPVLVLYLKYPYTGLNFSEIQWVSFSSRTMLHCNLGFSELGNPCEPGYRVFIPDVLVGRAADSLAMPPAASRVPLVSSRLHKLNNDKG